MSSASTLDQTRKEILCYCCCFRGKFLKWVGVRLSGTGITYPLCTTTSDDTVSKLARLPEHGEQEWVREAVREWRQSSPVSEKLGISSQQLPSCSQTDTTSQSEGQSPPPCNALDILSVKAFSAPGEQEEKFSSPILWMLYSQWNTTHYMQCGNGGKIPPVFEKELNAPSLLSGPMEKRWAGAIKVVTQSFQIHWWTRDIPPHNGTFLLFVRSRLLCK